jgi:hypothetical protein
LPLTRRRFSNERQVEAEALPVRQVKSNEIRSVDSKAKRPDGHLDRLQAALTHQIEADAGNKRQEGTRRKIRPGLTTRERGPHKMTKRRRSISHETIRPLLLLLLLRFDSEFAREQIRRHFGLARLRISLGWTGLLVVRYGRELRRPKCRCTNAVPRQNKLQSGSN